MTSIRIQQKRSYIAVYVMLAWFAALAIQSLLHNSVEGANAILLPLFAGLSTLIWWVKFVQSAAWIEIDAALSKVIVHSKSIFFRSATSELPLEKFSSVRSYITPGRYPMNVIELVTKSGGEALLVASMEPASISDSFLSIPKQSESVEAQTLRKKIATHANLVDHGFLGTRMVGAQIEK